MRVLLLGATGNLGSRCLPALIAHHHAVTVIVRNVPKLRSMMSPALLGKVNAIVEGDVTDVTLLRKTLLEHDIEGIIDVAGNQVMPWNEPLLPKIASAVRDAAVEVGKQRGNPLRAWITSGFGILKYPGTGYLIQDYMPYFAGNQHDATRAVVEAISTRDLKWSIYATAMMYPGNSKQGPFELLDAPRPHGLLASAGSPPAWEKTWLERIPLIGLFLNTFYIGLVVYRTRYEAVADFLAEDLERGSEEWVGEKVGLKEGGKKVV